MRPRRRVYCLLLAPPTSAPHPPPPPSRERYLFAARTVLIARENGQRPGRPSYPLAPGGSLARKSRTLSGSASQRCREGLRASLPVPAPNRPRPKVPGEPPGGRPADPAGHFDRRCRENPCGLCGSSHELSPTTHCSPPPAPGSVAIRGSERRALSAPSGSRPPTCAYTGPSEPETAWDRP